jgi:hypothetical protein
MTRRAPLHWPAEPTLAMLERKYEELFWQLETHFGRRMAGVILFPVSRGEVMGRIVGPPKKRKRKREVTRC